MGTGICHMEGMVMSMKKKILATILCISVVLGITSCGTASPAASDLDKRRQQAREEIASNSKENAKEEVLQNTDDEDNAEEVPENTDETVQSGAANEGDVYFGSKRAGGYQGFDYLTEERISTSKTDSKEEASFSVYIPKEDHPRVSGASARSERAGVYAKVDLEPYLQYKAKEYPLRSNLQKYVDGEMAYYDNYYDITIGEIREIDNGVVCEVSYMEYDSWDEEYVPHYAAYGLYRFDDNVMALVTITVNEEDTTDETAALISELSAFYEMHLNWDQNFAQEKQKEFDNKFNENNFEVYSLSFSLPDGWEIDEDMSDSYETVFAPGGDSEAAGECLAIMATEEAYGMVDYFIEDMEEMKEIWEEEFEDDADSIEIEDIGITFLGRTVRMTIIEHIDGEADAGVMYLAEDDENLYMIYAYNVIDVDGGEEAALSKSITEALDMFFETGRVTDSMM